MVQKCSGPTAICLELGYWKTAGIFSPVLPQNFSRAGQLIRWLAKPTWWHRNEQQDFAKALDLAHLGEV